MAQPQRVEVRAHQVRIGDVLTYGDVRGAVVAIESPGQVWTGRRYQQSAFVFRLVTGEKVATDSHVLLHVLRQR